MPKLCIAALLSTCAVPAQAAIVADLRGGGVEYLMLPDYSSVPLWHAAVTIEGSCGAFCSLSFTPSGFGLGVNIYHGYGLAITFIWDETVTNPLDGQWHSGFGTGTLISGYLAPGYEYAWLTLSTARFYDDGLPEDYWGVPFATFGPHAGVPEPATWTLMIGGLGLVGATMRRRKATVSFA